jgi:hypothetical protein
MAKLETHTSYGTVEAQKVGMAYSSKVESAVKTLSMDARADHVYITLTEYRPNTNRTIGASITFTQQEWREFKAAVFASGGTI